ncbi:hypothetical protein [Phormidium sp. CCY1219]|uniref:hypothetical protein n=1 Tax=Phormidium sp. CCY1219 TaxID=2886104 RepID=UPI002D1F4191|nr:hypothetical protein [Phormidium sp. CCY1219]MEB3827016.1 hypothetical protein [Phormidium sp. CCY1219]
MLSLLHGIMTQAIAAPSPRPPESSVRHSHLTAIESLHSPGSPTRPVVSNLTDNLWLTTGTRYKLAISDCN